MHLKLYLSPIMEMCEKLRACSAGLSSYERRYSNSRPCCMQPDTGLFGFPELHSMPVMLATRTRVAQRKGCAGVAAAPPPPHNPSLFSAGASPPPMTTANRAPKNPQPDR